ncbi:MAG: clostripain-related cysteine peptidase [Eubacteriales bacterium]|nr:clostripain-related cysteine peptidase [Eubacteriales bacterium]MDD3882836.1 clostripain-related cysteine peptidase [Eubacteriales bacterium]MDD4513266.1 clostripain-related cysteine peptidase [Eubacteriales bacterium]
MKKLVLILLTALMLLGISSVASAETTTTVMVYMCGTDLQEDCLNDIYEMLAVQVPDSINIVVEAGGASQWSDGNLEAQAINRFIVRDGEMQDLEVINQYNMGDYATLQEFIEYSAANYPADRYGLILWNHGGGSTGGICYDETADDDFLSLMDINYALYCVTEETMKGFHFDFIGCDACLMGTFEMASLSRFYADYYIASEELEPGWGWYYTYWLEALASNPDMPTEELLRNIADGFYDYCISQNPQEYLTISVLDLKRFELVWQRAEEYASYLSAAIADGRMTDISRARSKMYAFGSYYEHSSDMVDMEQFARLTKSFAPNAADKLLAAIDRAVIYNRYNEDMFDYACGISILLPKDTRGEFSNYIEDYEGNEYTPNYTDFVKGYMATVSGGSYQFTSATPSRVEYSQVIGSALSGSGVQTAFIPGASYEPEDEESGEEYEETDEQEPAEEEETTESEPEQTGDGETEGGDAQGEISAYDENNMYAYSMTLSDEDIANLSYVEGMLLLSIDDNENEPYYVDLGYLQNAWIDWESNTVYSTFDGTWPYLAGQPIVMYDQVKTEKARRSIIPVTVNDNECYLLVIFSGDSKTGKIMGMSEGYTQNGLPVRGSTPLKNGDVIVPRYALYYDDENGETQEAAFTGDEIVYDESLQVTYESITDDGDSETTFLYSFCLNDVFGGWQLSDHISFE